MAIELTWLGHGSWAIDGGGVNLLVDPFLDDSPTAPVKSGEVEAQFILISHGHFDHVADAAKIAQRTGAMVIANYEICTWLSGQGVASTAPMNLGGTVRFPWGSVKMTLAHHSSQLPDGSYGGNPGGFVVELDGKRIYFACDTALFCDMEQIGRAGLDLAVLPIGDTFTMGPDDALEAVRLLNPRRVAPAHYNTWPPIAQDARAWGERVRLATGCEALIVEPGGRISL